MTKRKLTGIIISSLILLGICTAGYLLNDPDRPAPIPVKQELREGVTYRRVVRFIPHPLVAHVIEIDTKTRGIALLVTPPDSDGATPLNARTTSQFLDEFNVQIAINGAGFSPWWSRSPADYYPHVGDPVAPSGLSASNGKVYSTGVQTTQGRKPTLFVNRRNVLWFDDAPDEIDSGISGGGMIVLTGVSAADVDDGLVAHRPVIGMIMNVRYLYLIVVDGREPVFR